MSNFDAGTRRAIGHELELAIKKIAENYGFEARLKGGTYSDVSFIPKVEFYSLEAKKEEGSSLAGLFGLPSNIIGKSYTSKSITYTVTGINPKRPKNCIELMGDNGKSYKCSAENIKMMLKI